MVLKKLIPLVYAESLVDFVKINKLFPNLKSVSTVVRMIFLLVTYFLIIICGMGSELLSKYQPLINNSMGEIGGRIFAAFSITFFEVFVIRVWLVFLDRGRGRLEDIEFLQVVKQMQQDKKERWIKRSRIASLCLYIVTISTCEFIMFFQLITLDLKLDDLLIRVVWVVASALIVQFTVPDLPILYTLIVASMVVVEDKAKDLLSHLDRLDTRKDSKHKLKLILLKYQDLVESIEKVNNFSKFIVSVGKVLAIPLFSSFLFVYLTPVSDAVHMAIRYIATIAGTVYTVRIYVLIGYLSRMTHISNRIHNLCASKAAQERSKDRVFVVKKLTYIMQDIAGERSHLLLDEFVGKITPYDFLDSIISTFSFLVLFASLRNTMTEA